MAELTAAPCAGNEDQGSLNIYGVAADCVGSLISGTRFMRAFTSRPWPRATNQQRPKPQEMRVILPIHPSGDGLPVILKRKK